MKPFIFEQAEAGQRVITRDGQPGEIIAVRKEDNYVYPVIVQVGEEGRKVVVSYTKDGAFFDNGKESCLDIFIAPNVKTYWANVYATPDHALYVGWVYDSDVEAKSRDTGSDKYLKTISFEVEDDEC